MFYICFCRFICFPAPPKGFIGCFDAYYVNWRWKKFETEPDWSRSGVMHKIACIETCRGKGSKYAIYTAQGSHKNRCDCATSDHVDEFEGEKTDTSVCANADHWVSKIKF